MKTLSVKTLIYDENMCYYYVDVNIIYCKVTPIFLWHRENSTLSYDLIALQMGNLIIDYLDVRTCEEMKALCLGLIYFLMWESLF